MMKKKVLGRGLSALIPDTYNYHGETEIGGSTTGITAVSGVAKESVQEIPIERIRSGPHQPRTGMDETGLHELSQSIREQGVLQPVILSARNGDYEIICGERRVRAAALAGLGTIPAIIREIADEKTLEIALVENLQREDLNPLEEARAFAKLVQDRGMTQEEVAKRIGKDRSTVANTVRILRLPEEVLKLVEKGLIQRGHARCLVSLLTPEHQRVVAQRIVKENLSVRQTEEIAGALLQGKRKAKRLRVLDPYVLDLERKLEMKLGTQVRIFHNKKKNQGRIEIRYFSLDSLDRILDRLAIPRS